MPASAAAGEVSSTLVRSRRLPGDRLEITAVFLGGMLGAVLRGALSEIWRPHGGSWPWSTLVVNVVGAALLGFLVTKDQERLPLARYRRPLLGTGLCGALTTFSTMQIEIVDLHRAHADGTAVAYAVVSVTAGLLCVHVTSALARGSGWRR
jgi:CrcB protein